MPQVSVILPVYNTENYVAEAIQSILNQTFTDFELLIIDDASTDNTLGIISQFTDPRITVITNDFNLKVVKTLNKGLRLAKGDFIARMDADDIAHSKRFEKQIQYLKQNPEIDMVNTWVQTFGSENNILRAATDHELIKARLLFLNPITHPAVMFRRDAFIKNNLYYNEEFVNAEDYGLWVAAIDKIKLAAVPEVLFKYRMHDNNISVLKSSNSSVLDEMHYKIYSTLLGKLGLGEVTNDELLMHRNLGLSKLDDIDFKSFKNYMLWLKRILLANAESNYFDRRALINVILAYVFLLSKRIGFSRSAVMFALECFRPLITKAYLLHYLYSRTQNRFVQVKRF